MNISFVFFIVAILAGYCNGFEATNPDCLQPIESGMCLAYIPQYAYCAKKGRCVSFIYGGCGGNSNRFATKEECERTCQC